MMNQVNIWKQAIPLLLRWYRSQGRNLPWRSDKPDPYVIWLSEIMLQQTRIEAVIPYFTRFLEELPTVFALAAVDDDRLMKLWEGLGYYSRARNLKKAAIVICEKYGGKMPHPAEELEKLPGIGAYTAGAIASIAFGEPAPAVDGNVLRVNARLIASEEDIALPKTKKDAIALLKSLYPTGRDAGDLTQAIMELGEVTCIPNGRPDCEHCPLSQICLAHKQNRTDSLPVKSPKAAKKQMDMTVFLLSCDGKYALKKREEPGLLSGMWEFYHTSGHLSPEDSLAFLLDQGFTPLTIAPAGKAKHIFTHLEWQMIGYSVVCQREREGFIWITPEEIRDHYAIPGAFKTFAKTVIHYGKTMTK